MTIGRTPYFAQAYRAPVATPRFGSTGAEVAGAQSAEQEILRRIQSLPAGGPRLTIGRATRSSHPDLAIPDYSATNGVSRRHGEIWRDQAGQLWYKDVGSTEGSTINGREVERGGQPMRLKPGDRLKLGRRFSFTLQLPQ